MEWGAQQVTSNRSGMLTYSIERFDAGLDWAARAAADACVALGGSVGPVDLPEAV